MLGWGLAIILPEQVKSCLHRCTRMGLYNTTPVLPYTDPIFSRICSGAVALTPPSPHRLHIPRCIQSSSGLWEQKQLCVVLLSWFRGGSSAPTARFLLLTFCLLHIAGILAFDSVWHTWPRASFCSAVLLKIAAVCLGSTSSLDRLAQKKASPSGRVTYDCLRLASMPATTCTCIC